MSASSLSAVSQEPGGRQAPRTDASGLSCELRLVAQSLAWPRDERTRAVLRSLAASNPNWPKVLQLAERHRVVGLVAHALDAAAVVLPAQVEASLRARAQEIAFEELGMVAEVTRLSHACSREGLRLVVLKGVTAAMQAFGRIGLRQNRDIDVLVSAEDLARVVSVLGRLGYRQIEPDQVLAGAALEEWARGHKDVVFRKGDRGVVVEVHWRLFDNPRFAQRLGGGRPERLQLPSGAVIEALPLDEAFLYMAAHGAQHAWSRLKWLADFSATAAKLGPQAVAELYRQSKREGLGGPVGQGLLLARELIGAPVPPEVLADARTWRLRALRQLALAAIGGPSVVELEDRAFGSTLKTVSHYLLRGGFAYLLAQAVLDASEVPKSYASPWMRRLGPFAKGPLWLYVRLRRSARRAGAVRSRRDSREA